MKVTVHDLCYTETYGAVFKNLTSVGMYTCAHFCMRNTSCQSAIYNESAGLCSLNSLFLPNRPTCNLNVKYVQMGEYQVMLISSLKDCDTDMNFLSTFPLNQNAPFQR